jgi:predicted amidophosphoribosyltransferase
MCAVGVAAFGRLGETLASTVLSAVLSAVHAVGERGARPVGDLVDAIAPQVCPLCRAARGSCGCEEFCELRASVRRTGDAVGRCAICAARVPPALDGRTCRVCREDPPPFASAAALFDYRSEGKRDWVLRFKHGGRPDLAEELGQRLAHAVRAHGRFCADVACSSTSTPHPAPRACVVPIPLHPLRRFERGYDQAWLLARALAECLELDARRVLVRRRATRPQGGLSAVMRRANVRGAFEVASRRTACLEGCCVLLVDDVLASGGTARAAARALLDGGARAVHLAVVGRS